MRKKTIGWRVVDVSVETGGLRYIGPIASGWGWAWEFKCRPVTHKEAVRLRAAATRWWHNIRTPGCGTNWDAKNLRLVRVVKRGAK